MEYKYQTAIGQLNYTNSEIIKVYKKWLFVEPDREDVDESGELDENLFSSATNLGGNPSFQNILKKMRDLNRILPGLKSYFSREAKSVGAVIGNENPQLTDYVFISEYEGGSANGRKRLDMVKSAFSEILALTESRRDLMFGDTINSLFKYYGTSEISVVQYMTDNGISDSQKKYDNYMGLLSKNRQGIIDGYSKFTLLNYNNVIVPIPDSKQNIIIHLYNQLPSKSKINKSWLGQ